MRLVSRHNKISSKELKFLNLAVTQIIEKVCMEKLKYEEYQSFQEIISGVNLRSKEINLNENEKFLGHTIDNNSRFELETENRNTPGAGEALKIFIEFLISQKLEDRLTLDQKRDLLKNLNELDGKSLYNTSSEFETLVKNLTTSVNQDSLTKESCEVFKSEG